MQTRFRKLTKTASGNGTADNTERVQWILNHFDFVQQHIVRIKGQRADGHKVKLSQQAAAAAAAAVRPVTDDVSDPEVDDEEPLVSSRSTSATPTPQYVSPPPASSTCKAGSKGPHVKSSSFQTALSALEKHAEESKELQGQVELILTEAKKTSSDNHMWGG